MKRCRCGIDDWRGLRRALGLAPGELAKLMQVSRRQVYRFEQPNHRCPEPAPLMLLRTWLRHPEYRRRLADARWPYPFPEDLTDAAVVECQT